MQSETLKRIGGLAGYLWLGILAVVLWFSALTTDRKARQVEEYPFGCDSFGYLVGAQELRDAVTERGRGLLSKRRTHDCSSTRCVLGRCLSHSGKRSLRLTRTTTSLKATALVCNIPRALP